MRVARLALDLPLAPAIPLKSSPTSDVVGDASDSDEAP
eukprot:CAMPEP_0115553326 /NCGR_PEP_ID=MMETSP0271-20121206/96713_1 /TAXON_ID=71861 /ORGANISM="Scrippsiella trochoidea, Strain CCMP3099" /LENGTH=37 /DNA_ID= /DNA_START= /DNA_END= /DNA_ORIENTATION=